MNQKLIFFDFDGVIADSFNAAFEASKMIHPLLTEEIYRKRFEGNINENIVEESIKKEYRPDVDFFTEYGPRLLKSTIFPGMKDVIKMAANHNKLVIVSSSNTDIIKKFLSMYDIDHYFAEIMGNDVSKSKIVKIETAINKYSIRSDDCLFVTDTLGDIKEAHHVGIKTVGVSWGYQTKATLEQGNPSRIVVTVEELLEVLR